MKIFFRSWDANFSLCSQIFDFPKVFWEFQKWTKINVHFSKSHWTFEAKKRKFTGGGNFWPTNDTLSSSLLSYRSRRNYILLNLDRVHPAHSPPSALFHRHSPTPPFSFKRENTPFLGLQKWVANWDMSGIARCGRTDERWTHGRTMADAVQTILWHYYIWNLNVCP